MRYPFCFRTALFSLLLAAPPCGGQARLVLNGGPTASAFAGSGTDGTTVSGSALSARLGHPRGLAYDNAGNLYVADARNHQVDRIAPDGTLIVVAGVGEEGFSGDGGAAVLARLSAPSAVAVRGDGTILIADAGNHRVRSVSPSGVITTIAGTGPGFSGDRGPATAARLRSPVALALDSGGIVYVADAGNHRVRRIAADGTISTVAGSGEEGDAGDGGPALSATLRSPSALLALPDGRLLIADAAAHRIRVLQTDGTLAPYSTATSLRRPSALASSAGGDILLSDADLQQVLLASGDTVAGTGTQGQALAGLATRTPLDSPSGVVTAANGDVTISDRRNHTVQRVQLPVLAFGDVPAGQTSSPQLLTLQNGGDTALQIDGVALPDGFANNGAGTCTAFPARLDPASQCSLSLVFRPTAQGPVTALATVTASGTASGTIRLTGNATPPASLAPSITAMAASGSISYSGAPVQLTATVAGSLLSAPTGTVSFMDGATVLSSTPLNGATTTYSTAALRLGSHALHATYSGDAQYAASTSTDVAVTVVAAPDFTLTAAAASYSGKASGTVSIPMTLLPVNGTLNHLLTLSVSGMPTGFSGTITPATMTIAADPIHAVLTVTIPATVAHQQPLHSPLLVASALLLPLFWRRRRVVAAGFCLLLATGCGGGFRTVSSTTGNGGPLHYNLTVSATTTGVLGDPLVHSVPVELVITP